MARKQPWIYPGNGRLTTSGAALSATDMPDLEDQNDFHLVSQIMAVRDLAMALQALIGPNGENLGGAGGWEWHHLDDTMPTGVVVDPVGLWQFNGSNDYLLDLSGEGNDMTLEGADEVFSSAPSILGFMCDGVSSFLYISGAPSSLVISDALTIEIIYCPRKQQVSSGLLVGVGATGGETDEANYQYALYVSGTTSGVGSPTNKNRLNYRHEYGVATAEDWETRAGLEVGEPSLITLTRAANGVGMAIYLNGLLVDSATLLNPPDGGSGSLEFQIGYNCHGTVFSVRITPVAFTAGQVLDAYERVRRDA